MHRNLSSNLGLLAIALLAAGPSLSAPTLFTVDTAAQRGSAGDLTGNCTLGDAIVAANADAAVDACAHPNLGTGGPFEIVLPAASGPYVLDLSEPGTDGRVGLPVVGSNVIVLGDGNTVERNGALACPDPVGDEFRLFEVASGARLVLEDLDLRNGCAPSSGAIHNAGQLVLRGVTVRSSSAFSSDGGGIGNARGNAELVDTAVIDNLAYGYGGGIFNWNAQLVLKRSTVARNDATNGGGIENQTADATLMNSTVSTNTAINGGGVSNSGGAALTLLNSTVAFNTASRGNGLWNRNGSMSFANSILADRCLFDRSPGKTDAGNNVERWNGCGLDPASSIPNQPTGIARLADSGGPTPTHALIAGSVAIDAGDAGTCNLAGIDGVGQRGFLRPDGDPAGGGSCDVGAVEFVDCDANALDDGVEIAGDPTLDRDGNYVLDACEDRPPVAVAGPDQRLECRSAAGADAVLDGSASSDPEGGALGYAWMGPFGSASGATTTVTMPLGSAAVTLEVVDGGGNSASDDLLVTVEDTSVPIASAGLVRVGMNGDLDEVRVQASCSDACDPNVVLEALLEGATVANGDVVQVRAFESTSEAPLLSVRCLDGSGNWAEASAPAPARQPGAETPSDIHWDRLKTLWERLEARKEAIGERLRRLALRIWYAWSALHR